MIPIDSRHGSSLTPWTPASPHAQDSLQEQHAEFVPGCSICVAALAYALFVYATGDTPEWLAVSLTAALVGAAMLARSAWRMRRTRERSRR